VLGREHPEIQDAVQESLLDLLLALPRFRFEADVSHYAVRIALRRTIGIRERYWKNRARFPLCPASPGAAKEGTQAERRASVRRSLIRDLLTELPEPQAEAITLRIMLEHSIAEVATLTGVSPNTVKTRLSLARRALKRKIAQNPRYRAAYEEALDD
jgi:RNA polymerase sigma-70 factor (ECF subfamily)